MRRRDLFRLVPVCLALSATACSLVAGYDAVSEGHTADSCTDRVDNDLDGKVDCADEDCWGEFCDEDGSRGSALCSDGIDNDLDGLPDDFDPACWGVASRRVARCGTVRGSEASLSDASWAGGARVSDPTGRFVQPVLELDPSEDAGSATFAGFLTGARDGTRVTASMWMETGAAVEILLSPVQAATPLRTEVAVGASALGPTVSYVRAGDETLSIESVASDGWLDVVLFFEGAEGEAHLSVAPDGRCTSPESCVMLAAEPPLGPAPTFGVTVSAFGGIARIGELVVSRPPYHPCATSVPYDEDSSVGSVHAMGVSDAEYCVLFEEVDGTMVALRGERHVEDLILRDVPRTPVLSRIGPWTPEVDGGASLSGPVIDWDPFTRTYRGAAVVERGGVVTGEVALIAGTDCGSWEVVGRAVDHTFAFDGRRGGVIGYDVDPRSGAHTLFTVRAVPFGLSMEPEDADEVRWDSPSGEPGTFIETDTVGRASRLQRHPAAHVTLLGGHRLVVEPSLVSMRGALQAPAPMSGDWPILTPSFVHGTFDSVWIEQGLLWMPEPTPGRSWWGLFAYTARECASCPPRLGFAHFQPAATQAFPEP